MLHVATNPLPPVSLLTAITVMALAAAIHGTDKAVLATAYRVLPRVKTAYMPVVLAIMNAPSPLRHMNEYVATLPRSILEMKVPAPQPPVMGVVSPWQADKALAVLFRKRLARVEFDEAQFRFPDLSATASYLPTRGSVRETAYGAILASNVA